MSLGHLCKEDIASIDHYVHLQQIKWFFKRNFQTGILGALTRKHLPSSLSNDVCKRHESAVEGVVNYGDLETHVAPFVATSQTHKRRERIVGMAWMLIHLICVGPCSAGWQLAYARAFYATCRIPASFEARGAFHDHKIKLIRS